MLSRRLLGISRVGPAQNGSDGLARGHPGPGPARLSTCRVWTRTGRYRRPTPSTWPSWPLRAPAAGTSACRGPGAGC